MRKYFVILIACWFFPPSLALAENIEQVPPSGPATKLEAFLSKKGNLITKESYQLGKVNCQNGAVISLSAMVAYESNLTSNKVRGLTIELTGPRKGKQSHMSFLDFEEIESLSKAITNMGNMSAKWKGTSKDHTEVTFSTKGDFRIGFFQKGSKQAFFSSGGKGDLVTCTLDSAESFSLLKTMVDQGGKLLLQRLITDLTGEESR